MKPLHKNRIIKFLLLLLLWGVLGFFFVIQQYIYSANNDNPFDWFTNLTYRLPTYLLWAIFTPVIYSVTNKFTFTKKSLLKNITVLIFSGFLISILHRFLSVFIAFYARDIYGKLNIPLYEALLNARFAVIGGILDSLFTYLLILAVVIGLIYYKRLRESENIASQLKTKLAEAKLDSLKAQLHPHFLFNTLNAITTLMHKDIKLAEKTLIYLSDLLRLSLEHIEQQKIKLKDEIEFLEKYLEIQQLRFQDKLKTKINVDPKLYDIIIPSFILQPVVENSIKYAVELSSAEEKIVIDAQLKDNDLILTVEDSGPGLPESFTEGIGIKNTRSRLQQIYNDNFELIFENKSHGGLIVRLKFPAE